MVADVNNVSLVEILNEKLHIDTGIDLVAIVALIFSIISTIGILLWQNHIRKKDNKVIQWNAIYPHRLEFYSKFSTLIFNFLNYQGTLEYPNGFAKTLVNLDELDEICLRMEKLNTEATLLFPDNITKIINQIYQQIYEFQNNPIKGNTPKRDIKIILKEKGPNSVKMSSAILNKLKEAQNCIKKLIKQSDLDKEFQKQMHLNNISMKTME